MKVMCYIIEEVRGVYSRRLEDIVVYEKEEDAVWYRDNYNRNSAHLNIPTFIRIAEILK